MEQQLPQQLKPEAPKRRWLVMYILIVLAAFIAVGGTAAGVYYLQQSQIDQLAAENEKLFESHRPTTDTPTVKTELATFERPAVPFTFKYPADWSVVIPDDFLGDGADVQGYPDYVINLYPPGALDEMDGIGGLAVTKGARISVNVSKTNHKDMDAMAKTESFKQMTTDQTSATLAAQPGLSYRSRWESNDKLVVSTIKDGRQYGVSFDVPGSAEKSDAQYAAYQELIKTFAFK